MSTIFLIAPRTLMLIHPAGHAGKSTDRPVCYAPPCQLLLLICLDCTVDFHVDVTASHNTVFLLIWPSR